MPTSSSRSFVTISSQPSSIKSKGLKMKYIKMSSALIIVFGLLCAAVTAELDCSTSDSPVMCKGGKVVRNVIHHVLRDNSDNPLKLVPGLEIVESESVNEIDGNARSNGVEDSSWSGRVSKYLQNHELKIKFKDLLLQSDIQDVITRAMKSIDESKDVVESRKGKDKGGLGMVLAMGMMMGKMMGAIGLGGVGLLAAKALGVSMLALMLAAIIGIKKLADSGHDDGGHQVHYVQAHGEHHRKKRSLSNGGDVPLPYKGWAHLMQ